MSIHLNVPLYRNALIDAKIDFLEKKEKNPAAEDVYKKADSFYEAVMYAKIEKWSPFFGRKDYHNIVVELVKAQATSIKKGSTGKAVDKAIAKQADILYRYKLIGHLDSHSFFGEDGFDKAVEEGTNALLDVKRVPYIHRELMNAIDYCMIKNIATAKGGTTVAQDMLDADEDFKSTVAGEFDTDVNHAHFVPVVSTGGVPAGSRRGHIKTGKKKVGDKNQVFLAYLERPVVGRYHSCPGYDKAQVDAVTVLTHNGTATAAEDLTRRQILMEADKLISDWMWQKPLPDILRDTDTYKASIHRTKQGYSKFLRKASKNLHTNEATAAVYAEADRLFEAGEIANPNAAVKSDGAALYMQKTSRNASRTPW
jgi:hypothetical protein